MAKGKGPQHEIGKYGFHYAGGIFLYRFKSAKISSLTVCKEGVVIYSKSCKENIAEIMNDCQFENKCWVINEAEKIKLILQNLKVNELKIPDILQTYNAIAMPQIISSNPTKSNEKIPVSMPSTEAKIVEQTSQNFLSRCLSQRRASVGICSVS